MLVLNGVFRIIMDRMPSEDNLGDHPFQHALVLRPAFGTSTMLQGSSLFEEMLLLLFLSLPVVLGGLNHTAPFNICIVNGQWDGAGILA